MNFATGANHAGGPQVSDNQCSTCHIPQGELEFDASIKGAHLVPEDSTSLHGLVLEIVKVDNGTAGRQPTVTFTVKDKSGAAVPLDRLEQHILVDGRTHSRLRVYQLRLGCHNARLRFRERDWSAVQSSWNVRLYLSTRNTCRCEGKFCDRHRKPSHRDPAGRDYDQMDVRYGAVNKVFYFSVDGSPVQPRRTVVQTASCNQCHSFLSFHGDNRNQVEMCVLCHNPSPTADPDEANQLAPGC